MRKRKYLLMALAAAAAAAVVVVWTTYAWEDVEPAYEDISDNWEG